MRTEKILDPYFEFPFMIKTQTHMQENLPLIVQLHGAGERGGGMPWNAGVLTMPVWAFHGAKDGLVYPYETENMIRKMQDAGFTPKFTLFPEYGHNSWEPAYSEELLCWLLQQKKDGEDVVHDA